MIAPTSYAPCIHLHISTERPCPRCLIHNLHRQTHLSSPEPQDPTCSICLTDYHTANPDTHTTETPIRLPCNHTIGRACLTRWLTPATKGGGNGNTCPVCKYTLFKAWPKVKLGREERRAALIELEEQRAVTEGMLRMSIRHHQRMARGARMPSIEAVLGGQLRQQWVEENTSGRESLRRALSDGI